MFWYADLQCRVRWGDTLSEWFEIKAGVRQGGILSPTLYCIYVDSLVQILKDAGIGCHIRDSFISILLYADDMCLVAPSLKGLQRLLRLTENFCSTWDIMLNPKKSKNMHFGKKTDSLPFLQLDGNSLEWVISWKYLGVTLRSHKEFDCCIDEKLKSFYRSANAILRVEGRSNELVMLQLLESHCLSILCYAIEVISVADRDKRRKLRVAYNSIFRQIFRFRGSESVTDLQHQLGRPTWEELVEKRKTRFPFDCLKWLTLPPRAFLLSHWFALLLWFSHFSLSSVDILNILIHSCATRLNMIIIIIIILRSELTTKLGSRFEITISVGVGIGIKLEIRTGVGVVRVWDKLRRRHQLKKKMRYY